MNKPRLFACILCLVIGTATTLPAQDRGFGVGIILGEPTGFSFKGWTSSANAIDGGLAWSFTREGSFHVHADYLWHSFNTFQTHERIPLYYGIGGRIKAEHHDNARVGVRVVVGIGYIFRNAPVDLFMEVAPIVDIAPSTDLEANAGLGARFWFR
jgi:hypothetical protein